jgi:SAM-dependent methyltransferase
MPDVDHYDAQYQNFAADVVARVRRETFGDDYGQNGWQTADELAGFAAALELAPGVRLLDVACGSGGPTLRLAETTGCRTVGVDVHPDGVAAARAAARERGNPAEFHQADAGAELPFDAASFDAALCVDAINHLPDRARFLAELARVLRPGGRLVYTDPIVVTGWLSDEEMRIRSSVGFFLFVPPGVNERLLDATGFELLDATDATANMAAMAARWHAARERHADELVPLEGERTFAGQQRFFATAARLAQERRLSRLRFTARRR